MIGKNPLDATVVPNQFDGYCFDQYYGECRSDGCDHWEALWWTLNYLPIRWECPF